MVARRRDYFLIERNRMLDSGEGQIKLKEILPCVLMFR
jgi:hypothetical protein